LATTNFKKTNMSKYHQALIPSEIYHLFSRAVGAEKLFLNEGNYFYFLKKLKQHINPVAQLYAYTLLPNHFHLVARIRDQEFIIEHFEAVKKTKYTIDHNLSDFIMERFSNFLNSYTKAFNKMHNRKGALFMDYLKRSIVNKDSDFTSYLWYIHKNAVHHQITKAIGKWPYDSYKSLLSEAPTSLLRKDVFDWFGGKEAFIDFHQQKIYPKDILDF
jgi:REP element-mobilizing transposase RayT